MVEKGYGQAVELRCIDLGYEVLYVLAYAFERKLSNPSQVRPALLTPNLDSTLGVILVRETTRFSPSLAVLLPLVLHLLLPRSPLTTRSQTIAPHRRRHLFVYSQSAPPSIVVFTYALDDALTLAAQV